MSELDFESKTAEELEALMEAQELPEADAPPSEEPPAAEPEPPQESEPAPTPEAEAGEEPSLEQTEKELLLARLELAEEERKKQEQIAGRHGGELGYLRNKVKELEEAVRGRPAAPPEEAEFGEPEPPPPTQASPRRDKLTAYVVSRAIPEAINDFEKRHPESLEMVQPLIEYLQGTGFDLKAIKEWDDPIAASNEVDRVLSEAYYHVRSAAKAQHVAELTARRAEQYANLDAAKKKASMSGGGGSSPPPTRQKAIEDMTAEELDAEMRRLNPVY